MTTGLVGKKGKEKEDKTVVAGTGAEGLECMEVTSQVRISARPVKHIEGWKTTKIFTTVEGKGTGCHGSGK